MLPHVLGGEPQKKEKRANLCLVATDAKLLVGNDVTVEPSLGGNNSHLPYCPCGGENQIASHSLTVFELQRLFFCEVNKPIVNKPTLTEREVVTANYRNTFFNEEAATDV